MKSAAEIIQNSLISQNDKTSLLKNAKIVANIEAYPETAECMLGVQEGVSDEPTEAGHIRLIEKKDSFNIINLENFLSDSGLLKTISDALSTDSFKSPLSNDIRIACQQTAELTAGELKHAINSQDFSFIKFPFLKELRRLLEIRLSCNEQGRQILNGLNHDSISIHYSEAALLIAHSGLTYQDAKELLQSETTLDHIQRNYALACVLLLGKGLQLDAQAVKNYLSSLSPQSSLCLLYPALGEEIASIYGEIETHAPNLSSFIIGIRLFISIISLVAIIAWGMSLSAIYIGGFVLAGLILGYSYAATAIFVWRLTHQNKEQALLDSLKEKKEEKEEILRNKINILEQGISTTRELLKYLDSRVKKQDDFLPLLSDHLDRDPKLGHIQAWLFTKTPIARILDYITTHYMEGIGSKHSMSEDQLIKSFVSNRRYGVPFLSTENKREAVRHLFFQPVVQNTSEVLVEAKSTSGIS